jgi:hypothetical protein
VDSDGPHFGSLCRRSACCHTQENKRKETKILEDMKRLVESTLGPVGGGGEGGEGPAAGALPLEPASIAPGGFTAGGTVGGGA